MRKPTFATPLTNAQWERAYVKFGPGVEELLRDNPYRLTQLKLKLEVIDRVASWLKIPRSDKRRCVAVAADVLDTAVRGGDCYVLLHTVSYAAGFADQAACEAALVAEGIAVVEEGRYVYPRKLHAAETHVAAWLKSRLEVQP